MNRELTTYLEYIKTNYANWMNQTPSNIRERMIQEFNDTIRIEEGRKYIKVITGTSVHSFIVKETFGKFQKGDILMAASWRAPATNFTRGNVLNGNFSRVTWTGAI
jgi:hypothetical protein